MYLKSIAHAVPHRSFTQEECWEILLQSHAKDELSPRALGLMRKVLLGNSGIAKRHFCLGPEEIFSLDAEALNRRFEEEAPHLGRQALVTALEGARLLPHELDALFVCTCTGYLCPGLSSHMAEQTGMRADALLHDVVGLGCGAAIPTLQAASHFLQCEPEATAAVVAVEVCSAAFYLDNDPGVLISACLFADGASASIWGGHTDDRFTHWKAHGFKSVHVPENRELLRFENRQGKLRNRLHRTVPEHATTAVHRLYTSTGAINSQPHIIAHSGGRDVIQAVRTNFPQQLLNDTEWVLNNYGNMSSPSVLFALEHYLQTQANSNPDLWLTAFGAGFSAHSCHLSLV